MSDEVDAQEAPAGEEHGEQPLVLEGQRFIMRPSYAAIEEFQAETGKGLLELSRNALSGKLSTGEIAQIVAACVRAWGREENTSNAKVGAVRIAELIYETEGGVLVVMEQVARLLSIAVTGGYTSQGKPRPTTGTTTNAPPVAG